MATLNINETYAFALHFKNARMPKSVGQSWPATLTAQASASYDAGQALAYLATISWPYTVTGNEKVSRSTTNWNLITNISRTLTIKIYEYVDVDPGEVLPVPEEDGVLFIRQADWDEMTFDTLVDIWAWGTFYTEWTTPRIRMPLKLICSIDQADVAEPLVCNY